jgi:5-methylcytosine-specific restriction enzyme subunit McrC
LRDLVLEEWRRHEEVLTGEERDELIATGLCQLRPLGGERYELRPENVIGTAVGRRIRLLVRPKIGVQNVFFLMSHALGLTSWRSEERFPYGEDDDLFKIMAAFFEAEVTRAEAHGLVRDYRWREEPLPTLRGRVDVASQIRRLRGQPFPIHCRYEDFTEDTDLNRLIKAGFRRLLGIPGLDADVRRRLRRRARAFTDVADVDYAPAALPALHFTRVNQHWEPAARLAEMVLRQQSLVDRLGRRIGIAFRVDMNKVFEAYLEQVLREEARRAGWELAAQASRTLSSGIAMEPDLVLRRDGRDFGVADAKYKRLTDARWPNADLYQLLAYCVGLDLPEGTLVYAELDSERDEQVDHRDGPLARLRIQGLDLTGPPREVLERTRRLARELIARAEAVRQGSRPAVRAA